MEHEWHDSDVEGCGVFENDCKKYIYIESVEDGDGNYAASLNFKLEDLQYMAAKIGGALQSVNPNEVTTKLSREDIIMLAKEAKLTTEEIG